MSVIRFPMLQLFGAALTCRRVLPEWLLSYSQDKSFSEALPLFSKGVYHLNGSWQQADSLLGVLKKKNS